MTLVKWNQPRRERYPSVFGNSFSPVFNDLFDDFFGGKSLTGVLSGKAPAVNVSEDSERYHVELARSEEHTSELQSLMRISYAVFCLKKKTHIHRTTNNTTQFTLDLINNLH